MLNLIADSSCDLQTGVFFNDSVTFTAVPMCLRVGETDYYDTADLSIPEMLEGIKSQPSSTACPSPAAFAELFESAEESICVTISSNLSGTYQAAMAGREMVLADYPEKKVYVLNSYATAGTMVLQLRRAAKLYAEGVAFDDICADLEKFRDEQCRTMFTLENFDNLVNNGRMRPLLGTMLYTLGIHVIAEGTREGTIHVCGKARGNEKTYKEIVKLMQEQKDCTGADVIITHCQNKEGAERLAECIQANLPVEGIEFLDCRGLTSYYAMDKGLIICF